MSETTSSAATPPSLPPQPLQSPAGTSGGAEDQAGEPQSVAGSVLDRVMDQFVDLRWAMSRRMEAYDAAFYEATRKQVLESEAVQDAMTHLTQQQSITLKEARKRSRKMFTSMAADIWPNNVRWLGFILRKVWRQMYEGIFVNLEGVEMIRKLAEQGKPVVLLPTHKSHMDYLVVTYICFAYNLRLPHVVAGDNLKMPLVGRVLQHGGAFFIRRQFGNDRLYRAVFTEYIAAVLGRGGMMECFIEGGRSRQGKVLSPKTGFLQVIGDMVAHGKLEDVMLVPMAISYDKVIEGSTYVNEILGAPKVKENLKDLLNALNTVVRLNFGSIDVRISDAISMRRALQEYSKVPTAPYHTYRRRFVKHVAHRALYECNRSITLTATTLVSAVLLTTINRGVHVKEMVSRVEWLKRQVRKRGGRVARIFETESTASIVDRSLDVLGKLVQRQNSVIFGFKHRQSLELGYYRNQILHFFVSEALVAISLAAALKEQSQSQGFPVGVDRAQLLDSVRFVSQLFKFEFIYHPAPDIEDNFESTIESMKRRGLLAPTADGKQITIDPRGKDAFHFLCMLLWPFVDTYWVAIMSLFALKPDLLMEEQRLCQLASQRAEALFYSGYIDFYEAVSMDVIKTAFTWLANQKVIRFQQLEGNSSAWRKPGQRLLQLMPAYQTGGNNTSATNNSNNNSSDTNSASSSSSSSSSSTIPISDDEIDVASGADMLEEQEREHELLTQPTSPATASATASAARQEKQSQRNNDADSALRWLYSRAERDGTTDRLMLLTTAIAKLRKSPQSTRDPDSVLRHYNDLDLSVSNKTSGSNIVSFLLRGSSKL